MVKKTSILLITFLSANIIGMEKENKADKYPDVHGIYPCLEVGQETSETKRIRGQIRNNSCPWFACRDGDWTGQRSCKSLIDRNSIARIPMDKEVSECEKLLKMVKDLARIHERIRAAEKR